MCVCNVTELTITYLIFSIMLKKVNKSKYGSSQNRIVIFVGKLYNVFTSHFYLFYFIWHKKLTTTILNAFLYSYKESYG